MTAAAILTLWMVPVTQPLIMREYTTTCNREETHHITGISSVPKRVPLAVSSCLSTWMTLTSMSRTDLKATHRCTRLSNTKMRTFQWPLLWLRFFWREVLTQGMKECTCVCLNWDDGLCMFPLVMIASRIVTSSLPSFW